jgi:hypothetical protein
VTLTDASVAVIAFSAVVITVVVWQNPDKLKIGFGELWLESERRRR